MFEKPEHSYINWYISGNHQVEAHSSSYHGELEEISPGIQ